MNLRKDHYRFPPPPLWSSPVGASQPAGRRAQPRRRGGHGASPCGPARLGRGGGARRGDEGNPRRRSVPIRPRPRPSPRPPPPPPLRSPGRAGRPRAPPGAASARAPPPPATPPGPGAFPVPPSRGRTGSPPAPRNPKKNQARRASGRRSGRGGLRASLAPSRRPAPPAARLPGTQPSSPRRGEDSRGVQCLPRAGSGRGAERPGVSANASIPSTREPRNKHAKTNPRLDRGLWKRSVKTVTTLSGGSLGSCVDEERS